MSQPAHKQPFPDWPGDKFAVLTREEFDTVVALLAEIAPGWSAELNQPGPGDSSIVVMPEGANDLVGPCFVLHRIGDRVQLDQFRWDEYRKLGAFRSLDEALSVMRVRLSRQLSLHHFRPEPGSDS
jgi:hypothetical protein